MTRGSRHGQAKFEQMTAPRGSTRAHTNGNVGFQKRVPSWYVGDVDVFLAALKLMDEGKMPRPTLEEMAKYDALLLHAAGEIADGEAEND